MSKLDPEIHAEKFDPTTGGYLVKWEKYIALKEAADELADAVDSDRPRVIAAALARYREASQ